MRIVAIAQLLQLFRNQQYPPPCLHPEYVVLSDDNGTLYKVCILCVRTSGSDILSFGEGVTGAREENLLQRTVLGLQKVVRVEIIENSTGTNPPLVPSTTRIIRSSCQNHEFSLSIRSPSFSFSLPLSLSIYLSVYICAVYFDNQLKQVLMAGIPCQPASLALPCCMSNKASLQVLRPLWNSETVAVIISVTKWTVAAVSIAAQHYWSKWFCW